MGKRCCVCGATENEASLSLFSFPKHKQSRLKWKEFAEIPEEKINTSKICHRHFKDDQMKTIPESTSSDIDKLMRHRRRLIPNALPSLKFHDEGSSVDKDSTTKRYCLQCKTTEKRVHFKFPDNSERRNEWLRRCGYTPDFFNGDKVWYLCARHFSTSAMMKKWSGRNRLYLNAVPTLFMTDINNESSTAEGTTSNETTIDYSLFPTKILPATHNDVIFVSSGSTSEIVTSTPDIESLISESSTKVEPSIETQSSSSTSESSTGHDFTIDNELTTSTDNTDTVQDYTSPSTISKILALHRNSDCQECIAFQRHISNSVNALSQSQSPITPVKRQRRRKIKKHGVSVTS